MIFYGPPGTGKTYVAQELAAFLSGTSGGVELVQFHPSYAYEDFVEGIRPSTLDGQVTYEVRPGVLRRLCERARNDPGRRYALLIDEINGRIMSNRTPGISFLATPAYWLFGDTTFVGVIPGRRRPQSQPGLRPGKRRALPDTPEGRVDDLIETAKAHIRAKVEHPFRVIKRQFGFQKTRLRGMLKNRCKVHVLAALSNLFMARRTLLCST